MRNWKKIISTVGMSLILAAGAVFSTACDSRRELVIYNWNEYIAENTITKFEKAFPQYKVIYRTFENNETMYPNLDNAYDVIIPSEYMVTQLIRENRIRELDWSKLPNVTKNMDPLFKTVRYSQDEEITNHFLDYAVPYLYCTVGLVYDAKTITLPEGTRNPEEIWGVLFDEQYRNRIGMYNSMRESIGVALNYSGYSINTLDEQQLNEAKDLLVNQKIWISPSRGVDTLKDKMAHGDLVASVAWSGDHLVILDRIREIGKSDEIDMRFVVPTGSNWSIDMMCIPTNAKNVEGAHAFINFMYDPDIALANCKFVGYSTPNIVAKEMLDPKISSNPNYYPDEATLDTLEVYFSSEEYEKKYSEVWDAIGAPDK